MQPFAVMAIVAIIGFAVGVAAGPDLRGVLKGMIRGARYGAQAKGDPARMEWMLAVLEFTLINSRLNHTPGPSARGHLERLNALLKAEISEQAAGGKGGGPCHPSGT